MIWLAITFRLLDAVKLFDTIFMMTGGGPGTKTYTVSFYLYTVGFTAVPSFAGDGGKLDLSGDDGGAGRPAGAPAAAGRSRAGARRCKRSVASFRRTASAHRHRALHFPRPLHLFVLAPLYWVFITSIKPSDDYLAIPPVWFPAGRRSTIIRRLYSPIAGCRA